MRIDRTLDLIIHVTAWSSFVCHVFDQWTLAFLYLGKTKHRGYQAKPTLCNNHIRIVCFFLFFFSSILSRHWWGSVVESLLRNWKLSQTKHEYFSVQNWGGGTTWAKAQNRHICAHFRDVWYLSSPCVQLLFLQTDDSFSLSWNMLKNTHMDDSLSISSTLKMRWFHSELPNMERNFRSVPPRNPLAEKQNILQTQRHRLVWTSQGFTILSVSPSRYHALMLASRNTKSFAYSRAKPQGAENKYWSQIRVIP